MEINEKADFIAQYILTAMALWPEVHSLVEASRKLDKALGVDHFHRWSVNPDINKLEKYPSEKWVALLQMLQGPHGKTILRAYQVRHGIRKN